MYRLASYKDWLGRRPGESPMLMRWRHGDHAQLGRVLHDEQAPSMGHRPTAPSDRDGGSPASRRTRSRLTSLGSVSRPRRPGWPPSSGSARADDSGLRPTLTGTTSQGNGRAAGGPGPELRPSARTAFIPASTVTQRPVASRAGTSGRFRPPARVLVVDNLTPRRIVWSVR